MKTTILVTLFSGLCLIASAHAEEKNLNTSTAAYDNLQPTGDSKKR